MANWTHHHAQINGIRMHYVEQGEGPLVILCHGFPHLWFSWRHQIPAIAAAGWRVIAPDMRGMGQTEAPPAAAAYDVEHTVGDLTALLDHLGEQRAVFIGLDFGVFAIYDLAFRSPERLRAIIGLENPATPHNPQLAPLREAASWAQNHFVHIHYFEPPGPADAALNAHPREFLTQGVLRAERRLSLPGRVETSARHELPGCPAAAAAAAVALAVGAGDGVLRQRVRAHRLYRRAQLVSRHGSALGAAPALRGGEEHRAVLLHRQRARLRPRGLARR